jgi:predicted ATPase/DNA-binding SARP family transcriptional activator/DNA-binding CsgD family transcriptional regulator
MSRRSQKQHHNSTGSTGRDSSSRKLEVIRIELLGGFRVWVGPRTVEEGAWRLRKAANLVKVLALAAGNRLHREQVMYTLWPELGISAASNNLRQTVHTARRTLDPTMGSRYLASRNESLVLCPESSLWVDVEAFEETARTARRSRDPAVHRAALDLYSGELLPTDRYEEWAEEPRRRLQETYLSLLLGLAQLHQEFADYDSAIEALRRVVSEEPTREDSHVGLMRLYALAGNNGEALAQYGRLEETLSRALGTEPAASSRALREEIAAGRFPPMERQSLISLPEGPPDAGKHNLPATRSSFVGRESELRNLKRDLAMTRLLTLTGTGGCGKTRLALEVARELVGAYPDGVWLVELAPLSKGALVVHAVARVLGVKEQPDRSLTDTLVDYLRDKRVLLILDNCEHLIDAVARFVDTLLNSCSHLRILATSRENLNVEGELKWLVPSLSVPSLLQLPRVEELAGYDSVRLFVERARHRNTAFSVTPENAHTVARICERLDGIPLAIELAAARIGLSVEQIAQRLDNSMRLLTSGSRTASPRQRTLRGTLDWSHELLSEDERILFRRLSTCAGGWTLEAAEGVGGSGGIEEEAVLDLLSNLVDKSLVVTEARPTDVVRYRMLEPVRQYAQERLEASEEAEAIQRRHAEFFLALAEEAEPEVEGSQQAAWLDRLEAEHDNLRTALSWSLERGEEAELGLRVGEALGQFWYLRGYFGEGRRWLEEALAKASPTSTATRANALRRLSFLAFMQGDLDRAQEASEEGLKLEGVEQFWDIAGRRSIAAGLLHMLGLVMSAWGDPERAIQLYEESLVLSRKVGDERGIADNLLLLGMEMRSRGDLGKARELLEEGMGVGRGVGDPELLAAFLTQLCDTFVLQGDLERATVMGERAVAVCREHKHRFMLSEVLCNLGWAALLRGDPERATTLYAESLQLKQEVGIMLLLPESLDGLACVAVAEGEAERAVRLFGATRALHELVRNHLSANEYAALREPYLASTHSQLSGEQWEAAFAEGRAMGFEEAVEYALSEEELPSSSLVPMPEQPPTETLTFREREVALLVAQGLTNRQIAQELVLSEHTVHHHITNILKKLNLSSRQQVASRLSDR